MNWGNLLILLGLLLRAAFPHGIHSRHHCRTVAWSCTGMHRAVLPAQGPQCSEQDAADISLSKRAPHRWHWGTWLSMPGWFQHPSSQIVMWCPWAVTESIPCAQWDGVLMRPPWPKSTASLLSWEGRCTSLTLPWQKYSLKRQRGFLDTAVWSSANWSGELQNCVDVTCSWNYFLKRFSQASPCSLFSSFFVVVFFYLFHNLLFTVHPSGDTVELFTINLKYIHLGWYIYGNRLVSLTYISSQSVQITVFYQGKSPELKNV